MIHTREHVFPAGAVFEAARSERNWMIFAISETPSGKLDKHPANARSGHAPIATERAAFMTLDQALNALNDLRARRCAINEDRSDGGKPATIRFEIGYLCRAHSAMVGVDLDHCRNRETGILAEWAKELVTISESYWEPSTSGTGIRILLKRMDGDEDLNGERLGMGFYSKPMRGLIIRFAPDPRSPSKIGPGSSVRRWFRAPRNERRPVRLPILAEDQANVSDIPAILEELPNPSRGREEWIRMGMSLRVAANQDADPSLAAEIRRAWIDWSAKGEAHGKSGRRDSPERAWKSFRDVREISPGTFWYLARDLGWAGGDRRVPPIFSMEASLQAALAGSGEHLRRMARALLNDLGAGDMAADHLIKAIGRFAEIPEPMIIQILTVERARWYETVAELISHAKETERMRALSDALQRGTDELADARDELLAHRFMALARALPPSLRSNALRWIKREWQVG